MPSDKDYVETKQIMLGKKSMKPEFRKLADWIDKEYIVKTINICYDAIDNGKRPRLEICFEFEKERTKFNDIKRGNFDGEKQTAIANKFRETLSEIESIGNKGKRIIPAYMTENIWIIYGAFEPIAKIEAFGNIPRSEIVALKKRLDNADLWEISCSFSCVTFFLFTDIQINQYENGATKQEWTDQFFDLLDKYNEFKYFKRDSFSIYLDSKENFDKNYSSNWYYYYK